MFEGFERHQVQTSGAEINLVRGGDGPPVLLLHGYPQTHAMWHAVAPRLAEQFTVVAADLRGYGDSSKPPGGENHAAYSKRAMARDMVEIMQHLGFESFAVAGHDRGGRVAHRLVLDHPDRIEKLALLDIIPTREVFARTDKELATSYYHWFFLVQPYDLPETLIGADPTYYLRKKLGGWGTALDTFESAALTEYERCFGAPSTIHASCEDYRAAASIDLEHDEADFGRNGIERPLLLLWGGQGVMGKLYDVEEIWKPYATDLRGSPLDAGHFLAEEKPGETATELLTFLRG